LVDKSEDDERRDEGLLRMLKAKPKQNKDLKLGKPRNPRQRTTQKEKTRPLSRVFDS
jgi:hypothetical protein